MTNTANFPSPPAVIPSEPVPVTASIFTPVEGGQPAAPNARARKALTPAEQEAKNKKDRDRRAAAKAAKEKAEAPAGKVVKKSTLPKGGSVAAKPSADSKAKLAKAKAAADKVAASVKPVVKAAKTMAKKTVAAKPNYKAANKIAAKVAVKHAAKVATKPKAQAAKAIVKGRPSAQLRRFNQLVEWRGSQAELARCCGVSSVAVHKWGAKDGLIGRESAYVLAKLPGCPLTFEQMRPDVKNFVVDPKDNAALKQLVKDCAAYVRELDKSAAARAKAAAKAAK